MYQLGLIKKTKDSGGDCAGGGFCMENAASLKIKLFGRTKKSYMHVAVSKSAARELETWQDFSGRPRRGINLCPRRQNDVGYHKF
jgi:hypothetical protein